MWRDRDPAAAHTVFTKVYLVDTVYGVVSGQYALNSLNIIMTPKVANAPQHYRPRETWGSWIFCYN